MAYDEARSFTFKSTILGEIMNSQPMKSDSSYSASNPFIITKKMRLDLFAKGFSEDEINRMTPMDAWIYLEEKKNPAINQAQELAVSPEHLTMLQNSAINEDVIRSRGYRTIANVQDLKELGFSPSQFRVPGLLLPLHTTDGKIGLYVYRPDNPRVFEDKKKGRNPDGTYPNKVIKYEIPKGAGIRLDCPPICRLQLGDPSVPLWITEGQKKADALASKGLCAIALLGVWNFKGKNAME